MDSWPVIKWTIILSLAFFAANAVGQIIWSSRFIWLPNGEQPKVTYEPIHWLTNDTLVIAGPKALYRGEIGDFEDMEILVDPGFGDNYSIEFDRYRSCFSPELWAIYLKFRPKKFTPYKSSELLLIDPTNFEMVHNLNNQLDNRFVYDPSDCSLQEIDHKTSDEFNNVNKTRDLKVKYSQKAFELDDARYSKYVVVDGTGFIATDKHNNAETIQLKSVLPKDIWEGHYASKDHGSGNYLLHNGTGIHDNPYLWLLDIQSGTNNLIDVPPGPWDIDGLDEMVSTTHCFSCGCGCYRKLQYYLVNGRIFGHIFEWGFPRKIQGLYELTNYLENPEWKIVLPGVMKSPLMFSPDGCKVAYADPEIGIKNLCS